MIDESPAKNKDTERRDRPIVTPTGKEIHTEEEWNALSPEERSETSATLMLGAIDAIERGNWLLGAGTIQFPKIAIDGLDIAKIVSRFTDEVSALYKPFEGTAADNVMLLIAVQDARELLDAANDELNTPSLFDDAEDLAPSNPLVELSGPYSECLGARKKDGRYELVLKAPQEIADTQAAKDILDSWGDRTFTWAVEPEQIPFYEAVTALNTLLELYNLAADMGSITPYWEYPYTDTEGCNPRNFEALLPTILATRAGIHSPNLTVEMAREVMNCGSSNAWDHITAAIDRIDSDYSVARLWAKDEGREQVAEALGNAEGTMPRFRALMRAAEGPHGKDLEAEIRKNREKPVQLAVVGRVNEVTHYDGALVGHERLSQALIKIGTGAREVSMEWDAHDADGNTYRTKIRLTATIDAERAYGSIKEAAYKRPAGIANLIYTAQKTIKQARKNAEGARVLEIRERSFEDVGSATTSSIKPKNRDLLRRSNKSIAARLNDIQAGLTLISNVHANGTYYAFDKRGHLIGQATLDNVLLLNAFRKSVGFDEDGSPAEGRWVISDDISLLSIPAFAHSIDYPLIDTMGPARKLDPLERVVYTFIIQKIRELEYLYGVSGKRSITVTADDLANLGADVAQEGQAEEEGQADKEKRQDLHKRRRFLDRIQARCIGSGCLFDEIEHTFEIDYPKTSKVKVRPIYKQGNRRKGKEPKRIFDGVKITIEGPKTGLKPPETKALEKGSKG